MSDTEKRSAKDELRTDLELIQIVGQVARIGGWSLSLPSRDLYWSPEVRAIHEVPQDYQPALQSSIEFYPPEYQNQVKKYVEDCIKSGTRFDFSVPIITAKGRSIWVRAIGECRRNENGEVSRLEGAFQEITDEYEKNRRRIESEATLSAVFSQSYMFQGILNLEGVLVEVNDIAVFGCGFTREQVLGKKFWECGWWNLDIEIAKKIEQIVIRALQGENIVEEMNYFTGSGERRLTEFSAIPIRNSEGIIIRILASGIDVTARKSTELVLKQSQERFSSIARTTNDAIWDWDLQTNAIWWNDGIERLFGFSRSEIEPTIISWTSRIHPEDLSAVEKSIKSFIDEGESNDIWYSEYRFAKYDGSYAIVYDRGFVMRDANRKGIRMVGGMVDVTPQKIAEAETRRLNRALKMLSACNQKLIHTTEEQTLLEEICKLCVEAGDYAMAWVGYAQDDEEKSILPVAHYGDMTHIRRIKLSWSAEKPNGQGPGGRTVRFGKAIAVSDVREDPTFELWRNSIVAVGFLSAVFLPLISQGKVFGLLGLYASQPHNISDDEMSMLQEMADNLAFGVMNIRVRLEQQRLQTAILKIATSVSAPSDTTFFHQLAISMTEALDAPIGVIAALNKGSYSTARSIALVIDGKSVENQSFTFQSTPCEASITQDYKLISSDLATLYPSATQFIAMGAQAYVGIPLLSSGGNLLGLLFVLYRTALMDAELIVSTLKIFAARASTELERLEADAQLREQASLLDKAHDAILVRDLDHRILFWNKGAERLYGWTAAEAVGQFVNRLLYLDTSSFDVATRNVFEQDEWNGELKHIDKEGKEIFIEGHWTLVRDDEGKPKSILAINTNITQRKDAEREIYSLAFYDSLTGLPNRQLLINRLHQIMLAGSRRENNCAIFFIDLDNFKAINDTQGHDVGDQLLMQVADRLKRCVRESDTVSRIGGDEFVVVLSDFSNHSIDAARQAQSVADNILSAFSEPFDLQGYLHLTTPSIGATLFKDNSITVEELLKRADLAMYEAKAAGRNIIRFYDPEMQAAVSRRVKIEKELRKALERSEFVLHYQPQVDLSTGKVVGVEALIRWQHPELGMVPPNSFITIAEEVGLIVSMGEWVLRTACAQMKAWHDMGLGQLRVAVNLSARQFSHGSIVEMIRNTLQQSGLEAQYLDLELTESLVMTDVESAIGILEELSGLGIQLSIDDFGTGYSSLAYLKRFPIDVLKIDRSFIKNIPENANEATIALAIISMAHSLGMRVLAEGVETEAQCEFLAKNKCDEIQGFLISKPLSSEELETFILIDSHN